MTTSQIECFLAAAECLNFTKAAERLFISQTGLSRKIAAMENELGITLFERVRNTLRLTEAGIICEAYLKQINADIKKMKTEALMIQTQLSGKLIIGGMEGQQIGEFYKTPIQQFLNSYPNGQISIQYFNLAELKLALANGMIDVAVIPESEAKRIPNASYLRTYEEKACLVVPSSHVSEEMKDFDLEDFKDETFLILSREDSKEIYEQHMGICRQFKNMPKTRIVPNFGTLVALLEMGVGISVLNGWNSLRNDPNLRFLTLENSGYNVQAVAWMKDNMNPGILSFIGSIKAWKNQYTGDFKE